MKTIIKTKHEYLSGWTMYEITRKTEFSGVRNKAIMSVPVVSKEPLSAKTFKKWAADLGYDVDSLFTDFDNSKSDCDKAASLHEAFCNLYRKNLDELNSHNKCQVCYKATLNPNYKPFKTAFETFQAYNVDVLIEYKSGVLHMVFPSQGRQKVTACELVIFSDGKLKTIYEEEEAIYKVKCYIEKYIDDCDTDEKFYELQKKLTAVQNKMKKYF